MKTSYIIAILMLTLMGCHKETSSKNQSEISEKEFNPALAKELEEMAKRDQVAAYIPQGKYKKMTKEQWNSFKDSVFRAHQLRLAQFFDAYGFVGFDLAGEEGSQNFWLMVQHSDHDPDF
jgi:hypothetical protein